MDKEPEWDGFILIYNSKDQKNSHMDCRINVQVKGKVVKHFLEKEKYSIKLTSLKNYLKEGAPLFFVVEEIENDTRIFYVKLTPSKIRNILKYKANQTTNSFKHCRVTPDINNFIDEMRIFHSDCNKQISYEAVLSKGAFTIKIGNV